jgi:hypothetical protein
VAQALKILRDLREKLLDWQSRVKGNQAADVPCLTDLEIGAWLKRIINHLNLAEAMQQR